jgi:hypothetical protein
MARSKNGRWIYPIPKVIYVELWGGEPVGDACLTRKECKENGIGGKIVKFVPETQERTYDGDPVLTPKDESENP